MLSNIQVSLGERLVGQGLKPFLIAEIGINHNGDINLALETIRKAKEAGADAVKFQKRTIDSVYTNDELLQLRASPFGATNGDLKRGLELNIGDYRQIDTLCKQIGILWTASCWDRKSIELIESFDVSFHKVASPCLTHNNLLLDYKKTEKTIVLSTGMSTIEQIGAAMDTLSGSSVILMHCHSGYPSPISEINLKVMSALGETFQVPVGYSGHDIQMEISLAAVAMGACVIEKHVTVDRGMPGSDHFLSLEMKELKVLANAIENVFVALGSSTKRVFESERAAMEKLRRVDGVSNEGKGVRSGKVIRRGGDS